MRTRIFSGKGVAMAIGSICEHCEAGFSAPDASLGTGVTCPTCGKKTRVLDEAEVREVEERRKQKDRRQEEYRSRLALLEDLEQQERNEGARGGLEDSVRHYQPRAGTRNRRLRMMGHLLMLVAWTILVALLLLAFFYVLDLDYLTAAFSFFGGIFGFAVVKFLSEASHTLADVADRQWDIRALLLDMLEEQERHKESEKS
ncbi:MAG: hypothetical protein VX404_07195 [Planctomycetota bacterium]|nr:hypothetical protein [Planctomycetota bacterium]